MDYLKYLIASFLAIALIQLSVYLFGVGLGTFAAIGATLGYMGRFRSPTHAIAYVLWLLAICFWYDLGKDVVAQLALENPQKFGPDNYRLYIGIWSVMGAIALHPICYGFSYLVNYLWNLQKKFHTKAS